MQALAVARQRIRQQMQRPTTPRQVRLAHGMVESGQGRALPMLSSGLAQQILTDGYTPCALDRIYGNRPSGHLFSRMADRAVLNLPLHEGLRERFDATVGEMCAAALPALRAGAAEFRVLSAPCGNASELSALAARVRAADPAYIPRLRFVGVDRDSSGQMLPQAAERAREAKVAAKFIREDLRRQREQAATARREGAFHLINCVGIAEACPAESLPAMIAFYAGLLAPGGTLLIDRWLPAAGKGRTGLGVELASIPEAQMSRMLRDAGLAVSREHPTGEGGCVLLVATLTRDTPSRA